MSTNSIEWHEKCLVAATASLDRKRTELARLTAEIERDTADLEFRARQIAEAKNRGMAAFDGDRLLKPKK
jgi:hypothetical protein